jgi:hypothetical protein
VKAGLRALVLLLLTACTFDPSNRLGDESVGSDGGVVSVDADPMAPDADPAAPDAAPAPDGAPGDPDAAPPDPTYQIVETLNVAVNGSATVSSTVLNSGENYRLRVSGTFIISTGNNWEADAEYFDFGNLPGSLQDTVTGVDNGVAVDDSTIDSTRTPRWGAYQADHVYEVDFLGKGATISVNLHDGNYSNNTGSLTLDILRLQ